MTYCLLVIEIKVYPANSGLTLTHARPCQVIFRFVAALAFSVRECLTGYSGL